MSEQKNKTPTRKQLRERAELIVDLHLKMILSASNDAGWEGPTVIGRLMEFQGDLPESSGFAGVDKMPDRIMRVVDWPKQHRVARRLMLELTEDQRVALYVDRLYRGRHKMDSDTARQTRQEVYWSDKRCAERMGITPDNLRYRISQGYRSIEAMIAPVQRRSEAA